MPVSVGTYYTNNCHYADNLMFHPPQCPVIDVTVPKHQAEVTATDVTAGVLVSGSQQQITLRRQPLKPLPQGHM